jgi:hypothetical protein
MAFGDGGKAMAGLTAYWIKSPLPHAPLGFGVTKLFKLLS